MLPPIDPSKGSAFNGPPVGASITIYLQEKGQAHNGTASHLTVPMILIQGLLSVTHQVCILAALPPFYHQDGYFILCDYLVNGTQVFAAQRVFPTGRLE